MPKPHARKMRPAFAEKDEKGKPTGSMKTPELECGDCRADLVVVNGPKYAMICSRIDNKSLDRIRLDQPRLRPTGERDESGRVLAELVSVLPLPEPLTVEKDTVIECGGYGLDLPTP